LNCKEESLQFLTEENFLFKYANNLAVKEIKFDDALFVPSKSREVLLFTCVIFYDCMYITRYWTCSRIWLCIFFPFSLFLANLITQFLAFARYRRADKMLLDRNTKTKSKRTLRESQHLSIQMN